MCPSLVEGGVGWGGGWHLGSVASITSLCLDLLASLSNYYLGNSFSRTYLLLLYLLSRPQGILIVSLFCNSCQVSISICQHLAGLRGLHSGMIETLILSYLSLLSLCTYSFMSCWERSYQEDLPHDASPGQQTISLSLLWNSSPSSSWQSGSMIIAS